MSKKTLSYGAFPSPISAEKVVEGKNAYSFLQREGNALYWLERRAEEKGRSCLMKKDLQSGDLQEVLPGYDIRSKINEYGGRPYQVYQDKMVFTDAEDQGIYFLDKGKVRLLGKNQNKRYAEFCFDPKRELIYAVCEELIDKDSLHYLVAIDLKGEEKILAKGYDFYSSIALDSHFTQMAFIKWNHPNMPWDENKLMLHPLTEKGDLDDGVVIAGGEKISSFQPKFSPDDDLFYLSNEEGFSNIYSYAKGKKEAVYPMQVDFDQPAWLLGFSRFDFVIKSKGYDVFCCYSDKGKDRLAYLSLVDNTLQVLEPKYQKVNFIQADGRGGYFVGASSLEEDQVLAFLWDEKTSFSLTPSFEKLSEEWISPAQEVSCAKEGYSIHGFFYPPMHPEYIGPDSQRPPLLVRCHGGPTAQAYPTLSWETLFYTSRGFAVLDVNYRGSTGYGREYRDALLGNWGVVDVNDVCDLALDLVERGLVDKDRMIVKGRSAGGFTSLACAAFRKVFACAVSYYGIADLQALLQIDHKFEKFYNQRLVGEDPKAYKERSPLFHISHIECPILLFHGKKDPVVPFAQSQEIYEKLKSKGKVVSMTLFADEGHGFRSKQNLQKAYEKELAFFQECFGLKEAKA